MLPQDIQSRRDEEVLQVENALAAISLERNAIRRDPRLNPELIAHNTGRYYEIILTHMRWLNTHGFVASISDGVLSVHQREAKGKTSTL